jgi:hypothetical protein
MKRNCLSLRMRPLRKYNRTLLRSFLSQNSECWALYFSGRRRQANTRIHPTGFASLRSARLRVMRQPLGRYHVNIAIKAEAKSHSAEEIMSDTNNPASRLHLQLETIRNKVKTTKPTTTARNSGAEIKLRTVLADVSGNNETETVKLFLFLVDLANLARKSAEAIKTVPNINHKTYIDPLQKIEKGLLSTNVDVLAKTFAKRVLTEIDMLSLRVCADMLSTVYVDTTIPANDITALQKDVESLLADVMKTNLPNDLRDFLIDNLEKMRQALLGYRIRGNQGIREVVESALGASFLRRDELIEQAKDETKRKTLEKFFAVIEKATKILSLAEKVKTLAAPAMALLLPPK